VSRDRHCGFGRRFDEPRREPSATSARAARRRTFDFSRQSVAVNHYYFYLRDPDWGPTSIEAISRDGRRPLISRRDCAMDCKDVRVEYFELTLP